MFVNSLLFLYLFLPVTLFFFYISSEKLKNSVLLLASFIFYAWGGISYLSVLAGSTIVNYLVGLALGQSRKAGYRKTWLVAGILLNLLPLLLFKYTGFFKDNLNILIALFKISPLVIRNFALPLGISFYSFKAITYLVSVHRGETPVQRNYTDLALYISFFPSVLAGPIDRYRNFLPQLHGDNPAAEQFASGIRRFAIGLGKKVLIANSIAVVSDELFNGPVSNLSAPLAWLGVICYALQIYYDFSGYTDMAIGVGRMFGFELTENFNFPYISRSIKEFWQRWHISLSTWLRDYLFLPIAYSTSRKLKKEKYFSIRVDRIIYMVATSVTFLVCGFWHGAAWNFIAWGLIHGFLLILEQLGVGRLLKKLYKPLRNLYAIFFLLISWVFFRTVSIPDAFQYTGVLFGIGAKPVDWVLVLDYFNTGFILTLIIAILGTTRIFAVAVEWFRKISREPGMLMRSIFVNVFEVSSILVVIMILVLSSLFMVAGTNNAFIYFKF
jgi:alginate O-acetyltransferase complex protein AlgI